MAQHLQINKHNTTHIQNQGQKHIIISIDAKNAFTFDKIQHPIDKSSEETRNRTL
jgi:hypothetical protein